MTDSNYSAQPAAQARMRQGTFLGVPPATRATTGQIAIMGLPFDCGTHATRIGSRQGPAAFRAMSSEVRPLYPPLADADPREGRRVVDLGDVDVVASDIGPSMAAMEAAVAEVVNADAVPLCVGGDGTVTLPVLRALARRYPDLTLIHIDAHTDSYPGESLNTSTTFTLAALEGLVDTKHSFHIGARGTMSVAGAYDHTRSLGFRMITGDEVRKRGAEAIAAEICQTIGARPVHLSFDMDYFDPSAAPGVATPTWGGPPVAEVFDLLHGLNGLDFVGVDINTLSPPHDTQGMAAMLAGHVAVIAMHLVQLGQAAHHPNGGPRL
ncbi:arginase family protein [Acetobacter sp. TBRC 12305]|uniref:Arginase family protein n=1 Tax=Acetobacter garciniae TaxID=2817435 RepID=A0A939HMK5_9PROT|nr:arginase family protein [Acetobacter garciniae]MBO1325695.1 arginase family protein [Acetobacter garciniae]MBX0345595.1 arginase family protein [Acetobacter garciniae]